MFARKIALTLPILIATVGMTFAKDLVVTQFGIVLSGAPYAVAIEKGYFKEAGVDITDIVPGSGGGTTARNMMAGDLGYGEVVLSAAIAGALEGQDIRIVNVGSRTIDDLVLLVKPNSDITSVSQLAGKKIGISNPKSLSEVISVLAVEKGGVPIDKVQRVTLGSLGGTLTALENGSTDVAATLLIGMGERSKKYRVLINGATDLQPMVQSVGVATGDLMRKDPKTLRAILDARAKGVDFIYSHPKEATDLIRKYFSKLKPEVFEQDMLELVKQKHWSRGDFEMDRLNAAAHGLKLIGALDQDVPWEKVLDKSFLPAPAKN